MGSRTTLSDPRAALRIAEQLERQAARIDDPRLKRIVLASSCEVIDAVLRQHRPPQSR